MSENQLDIEIGKRLEELIEKLSTNSRQFAKSFNIDPSQFTKITKGIRGLSIEKAVEISSTHNVNLEWLITGQGPIFKNELKEDQKAKQQESPQSSEFLELTKRYLSLMESQQSTILSQQSTINYLVQNPGNGNARASV